MPRKGLRPRDRRPQPAPDFKHNSVLVARFINKLNFEGKKATAEKILNDAVANSKWAHVQTGEDYYVVGVLFNDDEPSFICYGVPADSKQTPPSELENTCVWLPVGDGEKGYWVIYQSARTGEIVK